MQEQSASLDIALLHHPVINKSGETIGSAVTNLDLHDIARAARTYGVENYYVATPYEDQHTLIAEIVGHWKNGHGSVYNPARKEALSIVKTVHSLEDIITETLKEKGQKPLVISTSARRQQNEMSYESVRTHLQSNMVPVLLLFGTAHGLAPAVMKQADASLPPIYGRTDYNHLSVRSAVSIILDRIMGI